MVLVEKRRGWVERHRWSSPAAAAAPPWASYGEAAAGSVPVHVATSQAPSFAVIVRHVLEDIGGQKVEPYQAPGADAQGFQQGLHLFFREVDAVEAQQALHGVGHEATRHVVLAAFQASAAGGSSSTPLLVGRSSTSGRRVGIGVQRLVRRQSKDYQLPPLDLKESHNPPQLGWREVDLGALGEANGRLLVEHAPFRIPRGGGLGLESSGGVYLFRLVLDRFAPITATVIAGTATRGPGPGARDESISIGHVHHDHVCVIVTQDGAHVRSHGIARGRGDGGGRGSGGSLQVASGRRSGARTCVLDLDHDPERNGGGADGKVQLAVGVEAYLYQIAQAGGTGNKKQLGRRYFSFGHSFNPSLPNVSPAVPYPSCVVLGCVHLPST